MGTLWISHRGLRTRAGENTLAAFEAAVAAGFRAIETDLRLTRDGHIVLAHDATLDRVAGVPDAWIDLNRAEVAKVKLREGGAPAFLDEALAALPDTLWTFDIKPDSGEGTLRALRAMAEASPAAAGAIAKARFLLWSAGQEELCHRFFPGGLYYARERQCWRAGLAVLLRCGFGAGLERGRIYALPPRLWSMDLYTRPIVAAYQQRGARVVAYLPETKEDTLRALQAGVDEILTNGEILQL